MSKLFSRTKSRKVYKTSTSVTFTLPRTFNPVDCLPRRLHRHADAACWLVSTIVTRMAAKDIDSWACGTGTTASGGIAFPAKTPALPIESRGSGARSHDHRLYVAPFVPGGRLPTAALMDPRR